MIDSNTPLWLYKQAAQTPLVSLLRDTLLCCISYCCNIRFKKKRFVSCGLSLSTLNSVGCTGNTKIDVAETSEGGDDRGNGGKAVAIIVKQLTGETGTPQSSLQLD